MAGDRKPGEGSSTQIAGVPLHVPLHVQIQVEHWAAGAAFGRFLAASPDFEHSRLSSYWRLAQRILALMFAEIGHSTKT